MYHINMSFMDLNINYLKHFFYVAKLGSLKKAGEVLFVSQPSITYSINRLEEHYKTKLLARQHNGVSLTETGNILYNGIKDIFDRMKECEDSISSMSIKKEVVINIGVQSHIFLFIKDKLFNFINDNKSLKIKLINENTKNLLGKFDENQLDIIIDTAPIKINKNTSSIITINQESMCFAYSAEHANNFNISNELQTLLSNAMIVPGMESSVRSKLQTFLNSNNVDFEPAYESSNTQITIEFIRAGLAIGYIFKSAIKDYLQSGEFKTIDVDLQDCSTPLCVVTKNREKRDILKKLISYISK